MLMIQEQTPDFSLKDISLENRIRQTEIKALARQLQHDACGIGSLCDRLLVGNDALSCSNAARILSALSQEEKLLYLLPRYDELVCRTLSPDVPVRLGLLLSLLKDLSTAENFRTDLLDFCLQHLSDRKYTAGTRSYMIHLAARLCCFHPQLAQELILCLEFLKEDPAPSIAAATRKALKKLYRCCAGIEWQEEEWCEKKNINPV